MEIIELKVADIIPYENNPRRNDNAVEAVANSIKTFGFRVPIIVDKENVVVAGHTRLKAAEMLGMETVPVVRADDLTEEQVNALRIADNKTSDIAGWDNDRLAEELKGLDDLFKMTDFGFGDFELSLLLGEYEPEPYDRGATQEYEGREADYLAKKRLIITYTDETEDALLRLLKLDAIDHVVYDIADLV